MRKKNWTKIMAFLALFWIIIWIIWTWLLIIFDKPSSEQSLSEEEYNKLLEQINSNSWVINTTDWIEVSTWELSWTWENN